MGTKDNPKKSAGKPANPNFLEFKVGFEGEPVKPINVIAYAFDRQGNLLASAPVKEGSARLTLDPVQARGARIFFAPEHPYHEAERSITLDMIERLHGYEVVWAYEPQKFDYELLPIPEVLWRWWGWCSCRVRGRVIKVETLRGVTYEKPVCHARVHICEVDQLPWIIARLPDELVFRLRDELIRAIAEPMPPIPPIPDPPGPFPDSSVVIEPIGPMPEIFGTFSSPSRYERASEQPDFGSLRIQDPFHIIRDRLLSLGGQPLSAKFEGLAFEARAALMSNSTALVREALLQHVDLIKIYWCNWDWLWPWYRYDCDELAVIETDENGRFDTTIWYRCFGDHPDLYFWVEYSIGEVWTTVYRPLIRCNTYWDYVCGTEVTIRLTDPRVHGCGDRPVLLGKKLVVKTIGRQVSMGEIYRASIVPAENAKEGQVKEGWIHPNKPSPFGAELEPRVDFGDGLKAANITHYRWSYRPLGSVGDWQVIDKPVSRHYRENTPPMSPVVYKPIQIGPDPAVSGYYTVIQPDLPADGEDWEVLDESFDLASAYFDTNDLTAGKYEMKLELFRKAAVGTAMERVDLTAEGVELYEITDPAPLVEGMYTTTVAANDRVLVDAAGHISGYRLVVHVDNRKCFGNIEDVTVNGNTAGPCGFLEYKKLTDTARIAFRASHPDNFASFYFRLVRVGTQVNEGTAGGLVEAASVADAASSGVAFIRTGDTFSKDITIETLMASGLPAGATPCTRAAFAEALHVYALATNGYGRLSGLDWPYEPFHADRKAFAITPA